MSTSPSRLWELFDRPETEARAVDPSSLIGLSTSGRHTWDEADVMLYALGVGAGQPDPYDDLDLLTENSIGHPLRALPTFAALITQETAAVELVLKVIETTGWHIGRVLHGEQRVELLAPIPTSGRADVEASVTAVYEAGSGAVLCISARATDADTAQALADVEWRLFVRGAGGFGGSRAEAEANRADHPSPPIELKFAVRRDQALIYRLSGDRNPLHFDPAYVRRMGFDQPILHGMATYGMVGHRILRAIPRPDAERFRAYAARFAHPVTPGDVLRVSIWRDDPNTYAFSAANRDGDVVLNRGRLILSD